MKEAPRAPGSSARVQLVSESDVEKTQASLLEPSTDLNTDTQEPGTRAVPAGSDATVSKYLSSCQMEYISVHDDVDQLREGGHDRVNASRLHASALQLPLPRGTGLMAVIACLLLTVRIRACLSSKFDYMMYRKCILALLHLFN